ncbi:MAG: hypothetical protein AAFW00_19830 [Bacteroidota bacterium]
MEVTAILKALDGVLSSGAQIFSSWNAPKLQREQGEVDRFAIAEQAKRARRHQELILTVSLLAAVGVLVFLIARKK